MGLEQTSLPKVESQLGGDVKVRVRGWIRVRGWVGDMIRVRDRERVRFRVMDGVRVRA